MASAQLLPDDQVKPEWATPLKDFSTAFALGGSPYPLHYPHTPIELYTMFYGSRIDGVTDRRSLDPFESFYTPESFATMFGELFNTFIHVAQCPECVTTSQMVAVDPTMAGLDPETFAQGGYPGGFLNMSKAARDLYKIPDTTDGKATRVYSPPDLVFKIDWRWVAVLLTSVIVLLLVGIASVILEGMLVAPDVLGYVSTLARNSRYLHLPKRGVDALSGPERARVVGGVKVMIQDVKPDKEVGKIALGLKHSRAEKLRPGRMYR
jgi:hypothetical protein